MSSFINALSTVLAMEASFSPGTVINILYWCQQQAFAKQTLIWISDQLGSALIQLVAIQGRHPGSKSVRVQVRSDSRGGFRKLLEGPVF